MEGLAKKHMRTTGGGSLSKFPPSLPRRIHRTDSMEIQFNPAKNAKERESAFLISVVLF